MLLCCGVVKVASPGNVSNGTPPVKGRRALSQGSRLATKARLLIQCIRQIGGLLKLLRTVFACHIPHLGCLLLPQYRYHHLLPPGCGGFLAFCAYHYRDFATQKNCSCDP